MEAAKVMDDCRTRIIPGLILTNDCCLVLSSMRYIVKFIWYRVYDVGGVGSDKRARNRCYS